MEEPATMPSAPDDRVLAALFSHICDGVVLLGALGRVRYASPRMLEMLGVDELVALPEELAAHVTARIAGAALHEPVRLRRTDGTEMWLDVSVSDATGDPTLLGCVLVVRDCSQEVRRHEELAAGVAQYRTIVENALNGVWVVDADLVTTLANPKLADLLGCPEGLVGRQLRDFVFEEDLPYLETLVERRRAGVSEHFEFRMRRTDGSEVWTLVSTNPIIDEAGVFRGAFALLSDITDLKRTETELARRALIDPLTGLPNRTMFTDQLAQALARRDRHGGEVAVLFCDLDEFKVVNDTYGHAVGDSVLAELATRLRGSVRASDVVARLSGDEFVVLCEQVGGYAEAARVAADVAAALSEPVQVGDGIIRVTTSIGLAATPYADAKSILAAADEAMYRAKAGGRARVEISTGHVVRPATPVD